MIALLVVRHSELRDFRQCPLKHKLAWFDGWHDPTRELGGARHLGTLWHLVLKAHYMEIALHQRDGYEAVPAAVEEVVGHVLYKECPRDMREQLAWMYDTYLLKWGYDPHWTVIAVEQTMRVPLLDWDNKGRPLELQVNGVMRPVWYEWTSDVLVEDAEMGGEFVVDNKSTAQPLGKQDIDLDDQFGLYTLGWQRLGRNVRGQWINQTKTKKLKREMTPDECNDRVPSIRTPTELKSIEMDAIDTIAAMYGERNLRRPYSNPDPRSCGWKCDFKEPHLRLRRNRDPKKVDPMLRSFGLQQGATHGK